MHTLLAALAMFVLTPISLTQAPSPTPTQTPEHPTASSPAASSASAKDVGALLKPIREQYDLPGMVAAVVHGRDVVARGADGVRKRGSPEAITVDDRMHLGSCTKAMTATLCALLVQEGKLTWDTRVSDVFPELVGKMDEAWRAVRLEERLTNHGGAPANLDTGGLWGKLWSHRGTPREQRMALVEGVVARAPEAKPGTKFIYSNAGFSIAGAMAERVTDTSYEDLMRRRVFGPLGMTSAGFGAPGTMGQIDQPRGHRDDGKPVEVGPSADNPIAIAPAGRVHCSIGDWARFVSAHLVGEKDVDDGTKHILSGALFQKLHAPFGKDESKYAMGWISDTRPWGGRVLTHSGSNSMWYCVTWIAPEKDFAVLVACNQGGDKAAKACDAAAWALIRDHLGLPEKDEISAPPKKSAPGGVEPKKVEPKR